MRGSRRVLTAVGIALVAAGVLVPLSAILLQNVTDQVTEGAQQKLAEDTRLTEDPTLLIEGSVQADSSSTEAVEDSVPPKAIAKLRIPRFGSDWVRVVYEGTSISRVLTPLGVGHYTGTSMPGQPGNFALAAHRAGSGGPFRHIDKFRSGDLVFVETASHRFTYRYLESVVVEPDAVGVIAPLPVGLTKFAANNSYPTLTSCTPIHVNTQRIAAWFELIEARELAN